MPSDPDAKGYSPLTVSIVCSAYIAESRNEDNTIYLDSRL